MWHFLLFLSSVSCHYHICPMLCLPCHWYCAVRDTLIMGNCCIAAGSHYIIELSALKVTTGKRIESIDLLVDISAVIVCMMLKCLWWSHRIWMIMRGWHLPWISIRLSCRCDERYASGTIAQFQWHRIQTANYYFQSHNTQLAFNTSHQRNQSISLNNISLGHQRASL